MISLDYNEARTVSVSERGEGRSTTEMRNLQLISHKESRKFLNKGPFSLLCHDNDSDTVCLYSIYRLLMLF